MYCSEALIPSPAYRSGSYMVSPTDCPRTRNSSPATTVQTARTRAASVGGCAWPAAARALVTRRSRSLTMACASRSSPPSK
jgi:hypothetical protein